MPRFIILVYRLIPVRLRALWSGGTSSSHLALASPSWASIWRYALAPAWRGIAERGGPDWGDPRDI